MNAFLMISFIIVPLIGLSTVIIGCWPGHRESERINNLFPNNNEHSKN